MRRWVIRPVRNATTAAVAEGNVGAGTGATVGKIFGMGQAMKSGVGTASLDIGGVIVGAIVAVNAFGDVIDPKTNQIIAGARSVQRRADQDRRERLLCRYVGDDAQLHRTHQHGLCSRANTVIGVVATNAKLNKEESTKWRRWRTMAWRARFDPRIRMLDGDTIFALSTGDKKADVNIVGAYAAEVFAQAIVRAVRAAKSAGGLPGR